MMFESSRKGPRFESSLLWVDNEQVGDEKRAWLKDNWSYRSAS